MSPPWRHRTVSANGIRQQFTECDGGGPLVVLLHGFPGSWWTWRHQLVSLAAAGYRVVAVDRRGCGGSDRTPRGYDLWTLAGDVSGLVGALGEGSAHLVGQGLGGMIGWTVAALHPRRVETLSVLAAAHPLALLAALRRSVAQRIAARHGLFLQLPRAPERRLRAGGAERLLRRWSGPAWTSTPGFAPAVARHRDAFTAPAVAHCAVEPFRWAARSQLRLDGLRFAAAAARPVTAPVLAVAGAADPCLLPATVRASRRWVVGPWQEQVLHGVGHFPAEEAPDAVTALLTAFLPAP